jgi:hypothetical protein
MYILYFALKSRFVTDWSIENINLDTLLSLIERPERVYREYKSHKVGRKPVKAQ